MQNARLDWNRLAAMAGFEREKLSIFWLTRQILQSKSGIFGEKFNKVRRKIGFFTAKACHRSKSDKLSKWAAFVCAVLLLGSVSCSQNQTKASPGKNRGTEAGAKTDSEKQPDASKLRLAPGYAYEVLEHVKKHGEAKEGFVGGRNFQNREKRLPMETPSGEKIRYREWDVHPKIPGKNRGAERLVTGSDGSAWFTSNHYKSFTKIE